MGNRPFPSLAAVESRAENTYSTLLYCTLAALPMHSMHMDHVASHIGKAEGIVSLLRGIPVLTSPVAQTINTPAGPVSTGRQQALLLPLDIMAKAGVREQDVFRNGPAAKGFKDAIFEVATRANDHLITARTILSRFKQGQDAGHAFEHEGEEGHAYGGGATKTMADGLDLQLVAETARAFSTFLHAISIQLYLDNLQKADFDPWRVASSYKLSWRIFMASIRKKI